MQSGYYSFVLIGWKKISKQKKLQEEIIKYDNTYSIRELAQVILCVLCPLHHHVFRWAGVVLLLLLLLLRNCFFCHHGRHHSFWCHRWGCCFWHWHHFCHHLHYFFGSFLGSFGGGRHLPFLDWGPLLLVWEKTTTMTINWVHGARKEQTGTSTWHYLLGGCFLGGCFLGNCFLGCLCLLGWRFLIRVRFGGIFAGTKMPLCIQEPKRLVVVTALPSGSHKCWRLQLSIILCLMSRLAIPFTLAKLGSKTNLRMSSTCWSVFGLALHGHPKNSSNMIVAVRLLAEHQHDSLNCVHCKEGKGSAVLN